jgi:DNA modification methylase
MKSEQAKVDGDIAGARGDPAAADAEGRVTSAAGAELRVTWWPIERPTPYESNPRLAPALAIAKVAASIAEYGWKVPLVVDADGVVIAGHTRLLAATQLGLASVPVIIASDLSPAQVKAFRIADNRTAQESSWDYELLPAELSELLALDYDLELLGFDQDELSAILTPASRGLTDPDLLPAPPQPISKKGDLWLLGRHRLLCGDATDEADVARLMDGRRAVLMATDPPYLVDYDGGKHPQTWANGGKRGADPDRHWDDYVDHEHAVEFYAAFLRSALDIALTADAAVYQWFGVMRSEVLWAAWRAVGLHPHQVLIWAKSRAVLTHSHYMWNYEPMLYGWPEGKMPKRKPPAEARAIWEIDSAISDGAGHIHPTMKPTETITRPIGYHSLAGELIYEPFAGSGTAIIAAEMTGRSCYALELAPTFVDVALARWEAFTGNKASRDG